MPSLPLWHIESAGFQRETFPEVCNHKIFYFQLSVSDRYVSFSYICAVRSLWNSTSRLRFLYLLCIRCTAL